MAPSYVKIDLTHRVAERSTDVSRGLSVYNIVQGKGKMYIPEKITISSYAVGSHV
jgi:hypothetical protein